MGPSVSAMSERAAGSAPHRTSNAKPDAARMDPIARSASKNRKMRRWLVALIILAASATGCGGSLDQSLTEAESSTESTSVNPPASEDAPAEEEAPAEEAPEMTASQANAVEAAEGYIEFSAFSKKGLIQQLSSKAGDGYPKADAVFAVNHIDVDWSEQAVKAAESYIDFAPFSKKGLTEQLSSKAGDGYTKAEAVAAVNQLKVNWNEQAVLAGKSYLEFSSFSRNGLIQQLSSDAGDGYTRAQAVYAANKLGL